MSWRDGPIPAVRPLSAFSNFTSMIQRLFMIRRIVIELIYPLTIPLESPITAIVRENVFIRSRRSR